MHGKSQGGVWGLTWTENDRIPEHDVVGAWAARDTARWVCRESLEIANQASSAGGGLHSVKCQRLPNVLVQGTLTML